MADFPEQLVTLIVSGEHVEVAAALGLFSPAIGEWGGVMRGVPVRLAAALQRGEDASLRLPDGQERPIHSTGPSRIDDQGRLLVPFTGEGPVPFS
ncbi:hypothetical protein [Streptomyces albicerus]|uniref:hypothetical protein n=1 Tax=Streptomyces albicerus TaxID=2569859 RepID=UPI00124BAA87|nr:hypothetical protein [Streptomyces albicerus]